MQRTHDYQIYAFNFHGTALNSIRDEFTQRVQSGLRRHIFVIDLEEEAKLLATKVRNTKRFDDFDIALSAIERCRKEYTSIYKIISDEKKFNLIDFWMQHLNKSTGDLLSKKQKSSTPNKQSPLKATEKAKITAENAPKGTKNMIEKKRSILPMQTCPKLAPKQHNKVGRPTPLSKKRYIEDEPEHAQLFIVIIGDMDNEFYIKLLSHNEPLRAIAHFLPKECAYDKLLPNVENKEILLRKTIEDIQEDVGEMRAKAVTKNTGHLQHFLPVISRCLAAKYSQDIFDQLSYYLYDIELLQQQYQNYYMKPYQITDVSMPAKVNVNDLSEIAESLALQGDYLTQELPGMAEDSATISIYLEGLLNQTAQRSRKLSPALAKSSTPPLRQSNQHSLEVELVDVYNTAIDSILKVKRFERLCVVEDNQLLRELLLYTNTDSFEHIHYTCLQYNAMRAYTENICLEKLFTVKQFDELTLSDFFILPAFAKLYFGENVVKQNLQNWLREYPTHELVELMSGCRLYRFKRPYNEVIEERQLLVLPSRLCFRDFTLFHMEEFLEALMTPESIKERQEQQQASGSLHGSLMKQGNEREYSEVIDLTIFIRTTSLKWQKLSNSIQTQLKEVTTQANKPDLKPRSTRTTPVSVRRKTMEADAEEKPGLPTNHPLLKGYNLEDIRQEIQIKNSKYYFEEGALQLYEERWCFNDMNKNLVFKVNDKTFNIFRPRFWHTSISSCLRFTNQNGVAVRVLYKEAENAKVVINYANGLTIYHRETYAEQQWHTEQTTTNRERKRTYVPEGAVIVHYQSADMILVMRCNGEVYRLYQYEFPEGEEEEQETLNGLNEGLGSSSSIKIEMHDSSVNKQATKETTTTAIRPTKHESKKEEKRDIRRESANNTIKATKLMDEPVLSETSILPEQPIRNKTAKDLLMESIENELRFLKDFCQKYKLTYLHLIVTTSSGFVVNVTHGGRFYRGRSTLTLEWHDYFANESYAERGDGVRMIWTADTLKCYHQDGTLLETTLAEKIIILDDEEVETPFTMSSSHMEEVYAGGDTVAKDISTSHIFIERQRSQSSAASATKPRIARSTISKYLAIGDGEVEIEGASTYDDPTYVTYHYDCFDMFHKSFAEVKIELYDVPINDVVVTVKAIDCICAYIYKLPVIDMDKYKVTREHESMNENADKHMTPRTSGTIKSYSVLHSAVDEPNLMAEEALIIQTVVKVSFGDDLSISSTEDACELVMSLERYNAKKIKVRDKLELHFDYAINITELFQYFVDQISKFKNYPRAKSNEFYFLEQQNKNFHVTGFRFVCDLPPPSEYNFSASNTFIEMKNFKNIQELMTNVYPCFDKDLKKFPRFHLKREHEPPISETFPFVMMNNIFVKIPTPLCNTADIHKFVEPIGDLTFKAMQPFLKNALDYYLRPRIRIELAKLWSANNWKIKHKEHQKRLFLEHSRTVLYEAMLRHNVFPKYHQFIHNFNGHVKDIDFFEFVIMHCVKTSAEQEYVQAELAGKRQQNIKEGGRKSGKNYGVMSKEEMPPEPQKLPSQDKLRPRHKYRGRTPSRCPTTITHITEQVVE